MTAIQLSQANLCHRNSGASAELSLSSLQKAQSVFVRIAAVTTDKSWAVSASARGGPSQDAWQVQVLCLGYLSRSNREMGLGLRTRHWHRTCLALPDWPCKHRGERVRERQRERDRDRDRDKKKRRRRRRRQRRRRRRRQTQRRRWRQRLHFCSTLVPVYPWVRGLSGIIWGEKRGPGLGGRR